jgi:hypothetical protein
MLGVNETVPNSNLATTWKKYNKAAINNGLLYGPSTHYN